MEERIVGKLKKPQFRAAWLHIYEHVEKLDEFKGVAAIWDEIRRTASSTDLAD